MDNKFEAINGMPMFSGKPLRPIHFTAGGPQPAAEPKPAGMSAQGLDFLRDKARPAGEPRSAGTQALDFHKNRVRPAGEPRPASAQAQAFLRDKARPAGEPAQQFSPCNKRAYTASEPIRQAKPRSKAKPPAGGITPTDEPAQPALCYPAFTNCSGSSCCAGPGTGATGPTGPAGSSCDQPAFTYVVDGDVVSVVDPVTHEIISSITAPFPVAGIGYDAMLRKIYLVSDVGDLAIVDGNSNAAVADDLLQLPDGNYEGSSIVVNPNNQVVYIASPHNPFIAVVNGRTDEVMPSIPVTESTGSIAVNPNTNLIYVSTASGMDIISGNTGTVVGHIDYAAQYGLSDLTVNTCRNMVVASDGPNRLVLFDAKRNELLESETIPSGVRAMALNSGLGFLYVINAAGNAVGVYDACSLEYLGDLALDLQPGADLTNITVDPRNNMVYVTDSANGVTYIADGGMNQDVGIVEDTGAGGSAITLACPSGCKLCCGPGAPGLRGVTGAEGPAGPTSPAPKPNQTKQP